MITAVVMVEESSGEGAVGWVQAARRAAARDLLEQLAQQPLIQQIILATPAAESVATAAVTHLVNTPPGSLHVGAQLAQIIERFRIDRLLYFGGASAPLLNDIQLNETVEKLAAADHLIITNNRFASDWAGVTPAAALLPWQARLPQDNMLGWVLSAEAGLPVQTPPLSAATRLDIDTPTDLLVLRLHPRTKAHLRRLLDTLPLDTGRLEQATKILSAPAGRIFIAGRFHPEVWSAVNRASQCWLRVVAEERGMVSSGRLARGEVRSLLAEFLARAGIDAFFDLLVEWADAAFIDTRVLMAHGGRILPEEANRFAADLGRLDEITDPWLREFTTHAFAAPIPIIPGGQSLLGGDMLALLELL